MKKKMIRSLAMFFLVVIIGFVILIIVGGDMQEAIRRKSLVGKYVPTEEMYQKFEDIYTSMQDDLQIVVEELQNEELLENEHYFIVFERDLDFPDGWYGPDWSGYTGIPIVYVSGQFYTWRHSDVIASLNKNEILKSTMDKIKDEGMIIGIFRDGLWSVGGDRALVFAVNPENTSFITINDGFLNYFVCFFDEGSDNARRLCELYGYDIIEGNWYMYIHPYPYPD